jgi:TonB family protein
MIALWMLYAGLIGALLCGIGAGLQRIAAAVGRPTRFIWAAALVASFVWPAAMLTRRALQPRDDSAGVLIPFPITLPATNLAARINVTIAVLWGLASAVLLLRLGREVLTLRRSRATWRLQEVGGMQIRLSSDIGPAVVGIRTMDVVLPEWILALDRPLLSLVLRHETEHRAARDPYLLLVAAVSVVLMPWNLALWWQARRLRFAVEIDCDARVLRADPRPERYGMLLLTIAQRRSHGSSVFASMSSQPTTQLEQRINAMRLTTSQIGRRSVLGSGLLIVASLAIACALQSPDNVTGPRPSAPKAIMKSQGDVYFEFQVEQPVAPVPTNPTPRYPDMLKSASVEGEVLAQFVVDTNGVADMSTFKTLKSTHELFADNVQRALANMRFKPALVGGHPVKQLVQMPFQFNLVGGTPPNKTPNGVTITGARRALTAPVETNRTPTSETSASQPFFEFQLSKPAAALPNNPSPRYPDMLRSANVEGEVVAQFVVNADGSADVGSLKVLRSAHPMFTEAVKANLPAMQFSPAQVDGRPVRQLMQMPFKFSLSKD